MNTGKMKTAKIYKFPARPRARAMANPLALLETEALAYGSTDFGSGWYHDEAIAETNGVSRRR